MADEPHYNNKRKYDDSNAPPPRRVSGFSDAPSYNNVPPPIIMDEIQIAKQKAQEIAARLLNSSEPKRSKFDTFDDTNVSKEEEEGSPESFPIGPVDLSIFFEDGKIYGYEGLKITVWISSISFKAYADISFESTSDAGKGVTDLETSLQNNFADNLAETKDDFLKTFSTENQYIKSMISDGKILQSFVKSKGLKDSKADELEVVCVEGESMSLLYC